MKIVIIEGQRPTLMPEGPSIERAVLGRGTRVKRYGTIKRSEYDRILQDADAVIARPGAPFSREMVAASKKARVIVSLGVGYEHIDLEAAAKMGIPVCNVPDYGTEEVADTAMAMILSHQRKINLFGCKIRHDGRMGWDWRIQRSTARTRGVQVGIIGLGRIGTAVAMRLKPFGCAISFYDPYLARGVEKSLGLGRLHDLRTLVRSSDIISIHTPLTEETAGMVDERFLALMKPDGILINTARGGIFKNAGVLYKFLKKRKGLRIGTDVWPEEPPSSHPLLAAWHKQEGWLGDRLIITPHSAFYSESATQEIRAFAAEIVKTVLKGGKPYNETSGD